MEHRDRDFVDPEWYHLAWQCPLAPLSHVESGEEPDSAETITFCLHPALPVALLRVCQQFYEDGTSVLYGDNSFIICCGDGRATAALQHLSHRSLAALRRLHIAFGDEMAYVRFHFTGAMVFQPNDKSCLSYASELTVLCDLLRSGVPDGQLDPEFLFSAVDMDVASMVMKPLLRLPALSQLSFCGQLERSLDRNYRCQALFRRYADLLIVLTKPAKTFRFEHLPLELQDSILSFAVQYLGLLLVPFHRDRQLHKRGYIEQKGQKDSFWPCCGGCRRYLSSKLCRCRTDNFFSSSCACVQLDDGLFLVNKTIRQRALKFLYRSNVFLIRGIGIYPQLRYLIPRKESWLWLAKGQICISSTIWGNDDDWPSILNGLSGLTKKTGASVLFLIGLDYWYPARLPGGRRPFICERILKAGFDPSSIQLSINRVFSNHPGEEDEIIPLSEWNVLFTPLRN